VAQTVGGKEVEFLGSIEEALFVQSAVDEEIGAVGSEVVRGGA
jgi:hypothetical protein